ncbi:hypothetical protein VNO77_34606 [Canavalia gladiata]|uniref:Uncharacterized protein n=1 Tax=Canavalia gladiata TaxID=3824 RepID=A0AAN9KFD1_CANGL
MQGFNRILMHSLTYLGCLCFIHLQLRSWFLLKSPPLDEAPPRYFIVWMSLVPKKFQAFFRGSSEQYGFLTKVTPPSIMGDQRNLSLSMILCAPFCFFFLSFPSYSSYLLTRSLVLFWEWQSWKFPTFVLSAFCCKNQSQKRKPPLLPPLPSQRTLFFSFSFFKSCFSS